MVADPRAVPGPIAPRPRVALATALFLAVAACAAAVTNADAGPAAPPQLAATPAPAGTQLLPVAHDAATGRITLTIPQLNEEMLYLNTLAAGLGTGGLDRGQLGPSHVVRFERRGPRILLVAVNTAHRATSGDPDERRAVEESFPSSVLASFAIASEGPGGIAIDATDFFLSDVYDVIGQARGAQLGTLRLDAARSYVDPEYTRAFPSNSEIRAVITYAADQPTAELRRHAADGRAITLEQHHSFVRLPEDGFALREFDPRSGLFNSTFFDFSRPLETSDFRGRAVARWRLEPSDTAAYLRGELVEPVKPIVYYLDRAVPEPYRSAFIEGGNWWNEVFESAGWRNAFRVEMIPEGVDPMDARYPAIYWVHRQQPGPSVGPSYRDPRTGEILTTVVRMDSYRSLVDQDVYMGLVPAAGPGGLGMDSEAFAMARRRQHAAHEIGHTIGLAHNFLAATQGRASVMDYPYPLIEVDEQGGIDLSDVFRTSGGAHDTLTIRYAYTWYPDAESEAAGLREILDDAKAKGLRFITGGHASAAGSYPEATQWVEGADMLAALRRTSAVRRVLLDAFDERAAMPGEPMAVLNRRLAHVYLHHRYALEGAVKTVGGMRFEYALAEPGGGGVPTEIIPPDEQRSALRAVLAALSPDELRIPNRVAALIPPVPSGFDNYLTAIPTPAGTAFDPLFAAHSLAAEVVGNLLHPQRAARLVSFHARDPANPPLDEVLAALVASTWGAPALASGVDPQDAALRRVAQRAALDGLLDLAGNGAATAEVRAIVERELEGLAGRLAASGSATGSASAAAADQAHRATARRDIDRYFAGDDDPELRPRPGLVPLPWP